MNSDVANSTINYYDENADAYAEETLSTDLTDLIDKFLSYLPSSAGCARILDLGCGAGRDSKVMLDRGYDVDLVDGSAEMCRIASGVTGRQARQMFFDELDAQEEYDGIWSCGALLHVPSQQLPEIIIKCRDALVEGGILYASFKVGTNEEIRNGRYFTELTLEGAEELFYSINGLGVFDISVTDDRIASRTAPRWVNIFARKTAS